MREQAEAAPLHAVWENGGITGNTPRPLIYGGMRPMKLTKFGHACVRLDKDAQSLDSGGMTPEQDIWDGAEVVLAA